MRILPAFDIDTTQLYSSSIVDWYSKQKGMSIKWLTGNTRWYQINILQHVSWKNLKKKKKAQRNVKQKKIEFIQRNISKACDWIYCIHPYPQTHPFRFHIKPHPNIMSDFCFAIAIKKLTKRPPSYKEIDKEASFIQRNLLGSSQCGHTIQKTVNCC